MCNLVIYCPPVETSYHASLHQEVLTLQQQPSTSTRLKTASLCELFEPQNPVHQG